MKTEQWNSKIIIVEQFESNNQLLSDASMGIYFYLTDNNQMIIHFKPLNEVFKQEVFTTSEGLLINFERDLIDEDDIEYALDVMSLFNKYPKFILNKLVEIKQVQSIIGLLKTEYNNKDASYIMFKTVLKVLILHLIRYQNNQFLELMEKEFLNQTKTLFYANKMGISTKRLNQILKEKLNLTAKQIIQQRQVTEAKRRLIKSEITTKELAFLLDFDSVSSFSRFFKKNVGVSPTIFKTDYKKNIP